MISMLLVELDGYETVPCVDALGYLVDTRR
jgi:hypothetical protein